MNSLTHLRQKGGEINAEDIVTALNQQRDVDLSDKIRVLGDLILVDTQEVSTYTDWIRAERSLARVLRILVKWGWVARDRMQRDNGHKFWYNIYWKTELAVQEETSSDKRDMVVLPTLSL